MNDLIEHKHNLTTAQDYTQALASPFVADTLVQYIKYMFSVTTVANLTLEGEVSRTYVLTEAPEC